ncbi:DUF1801 domain-containing protein [Roseimarinus sediminis]|jgi:uncharacterized protein YdhG (YjbR/CyaY superfamily)|uniref:DUF1801 domain-containing protein n=1 Tax=Roseimarinus sediminis TaxID=1610899 RepID=UPI003D1CC733
MQIKANTPEEYLDQLPADRREVMVALREIIQENLPQGFDEVINYGMISWVVPHRNYPRGYHVNPKLPLPFISIAAQKNHYALYHMGLYSNKALLDWFLAAYSQFTHTKPDMGKSCLRFKKPEHVPFDLLGQLCQKMSVDEWIKVYEQSLKNT